MSADGYVGFELQGPFRALCPSDSSLRGSSPPQTAVQIGSLGRNADAFRKYPHCLSLSSSLSVSSLTDGDGFFKGSSSN